MGPHLGTELD